MYVCTSLSIILLTWVRLCLCLCVESRAHTLVLLLKCLAFRGKTNAFRVMCADKAKDKFIVTNDDKNVFGSYYHIRVRPMTCLLVFTHTIHTPFILAAPRRKRER